MDAPPASSDLVYSYKPAVFGAAFEFGLTATALEWRRGPYGGRVDYGRIRRLRLSFRPSGMQYYRFVAELWPVDGPKLEIVSSSWRGMGYEDAQNRAYTAFVTELHRRIAATGAMPSFETGLPVMIYWIRVVATAVTALVLAALTARTLQAGVYMVSALIAAFVAAFLWAARTSSRRNRPGTYRPDALPPQVLP